MSWLDTSCGVYYIDISQNYCKKNDLTFVICIQWGSVINVIDSRSSRRCCRWWLRRRWPFDSLWCVVDDFLTSITVEVTSEWKQKSQFQFDRRTWFFFLLYEELAWNSFNAKIIWQMCNLWHIANCKFL